MLRVAEPPPGLTLRSDTEHYFLELRRQLSTRCGRAGTDGAPDARLAQEFLTLQQETKDLIPVLVGVGGPRVQLELVDDEGQLWTQFPEQIVETARIVNREGAKGGREALDDLTACDAIQAVPLLAIRSTSYVSYTRGNLPSEGQRRALRRALDDALTEIAPPTWLVEVNVPRGVCERLLSV